MFRSLMLIALTALATTAVAQEAKPQTLSIQGIGQVQYLPLFEAVAEDGETADSFVARIAPRLVAFSGETGFEACGVLGQDANGRVSVVVGTNRSHVACANIPSKVLEGYRPLALTLHSHGNGAASLNRNDLRFLGIEQDARSKSRNSQIYGQNRSRFSEQDMAGSAGYLATPEGVLHHDSRGTVRTVVAAERVAAAP